MLSGLLGTLRLGLTLHQEAGGNRMGEDSDLIVCTVPNRVSL